MPKALISFVMSDCPWLSACIGAAPTRRISVKCDIGDFYGNP